MRPTAEDRPLQRLSAHHVSDPELRVEDDGLTGLFEGRAIVSCLERDLRGERGHQSTEGVELGWQPLRIGKDEPLLLRLVRSRHGRVG